MFGLRPTCALTRTGWGEIFTLKFMLVIPNPLSRRTTAAMTATHSRPMRFWRGVGTRSAPEGVGQTLTELPAIKSTQTKTQSQTTTEAPAPSWLWTSYPLSSPSSYCSSAGSSSSKETTRLFRIQVKLSIKSTLLYFTLYQELPSCSLYSAEPFSVRSPLSCSSTSPSTSTPASSYSSCLEWARLWFSLQFLSRLGKFMKYSWERSTLIGNSYYQIN